MKDYRIRKEMVRWLNMSREDDARWWIEYINGKPSYGDYILALGLALKSQQK